MACGCVDSGCSCLIQGAGGVTVSGSGTSVNPFIVSGATATGTTFSATSASDAIVITPGGTAGHTPTFDLALDPTSPAPLSVTVDGLYVDCCDSGGNPDVNTILGVGTYNVGAENETVLLFTGAGNQTIVLPAVPSPNQRVEIKNWGDSGFVVTVDPNGASGGVDFIAGTYDLLDMESDILVWDSTLSGWARI